MPANEKGKAMKTEYLPNEEDHTFLMFATYDHEANRVKWTGVSNLPDHIDRLVATEEAQFQVWKRGKTVIVESVGWYSPEFHYRMELTELPDRVVIMANHAAQLLETGYDDESPFRNVVQ